MAAAAAARPPVQYSTPVDLSTQREVDALFARDVHFTPSNTFTADVSTGVSLAYAVHTASVPGATEEERVLLIMGFMGEKEHWVSVIDLLLHRWPSRNTGKSLRIVSFDNRGSGASWAGWGKNSTSIMAQDALALLDHLGWDAAHVVGISMGGMVSLELATQAPHRLRSLSALVTTRGRWDNSAAKEYVWKALISPDKKALVDRTVDGYYGKEFLAKPVPYSDSGETMADLVRRVHTGWVKALRPQSVGSFIGQSIAMLTHYVSDERLAALGKAGVPILIMGCTEDRLISGDESVITWRAIGEQNARLIYYEKASHCVPLQCPNQVVDDLLDTFTSAK